MEQAQSCDCFHAAASHTHEASFEDCRRCNILLKRLAIEGWMIVASRMAKTGFGCHLTG
jgi:hypothetical protein